MPFLDLDAGATPDTLPAGRLHYVIDNFTDSWTRPPTVVLVHGFTEAAAAWTGWVPHLARHYRVVRIDVRGFGDSDAVPADFPYSTDLLVADMVQVIEKLAAEPVHVVVMKSGALTGVKLAVERPGLVRTLTLCGSLVEPNDATGWIEKMERDGMRAWAAATQRNRMGSAMPQEGLDWWSDLMGRTALSTARAYLRWVGSVDLRPDLPNIACPTLVIGNHTPTLPADYYAAYQRQIPDSELVIVPIDGYHSGGSAPDACALATRAFLDRRGPAT